MNRIFRIFVSLAAATTMLSCSKDFDEKSQLLGFKSCHLYIEGYEPGESYFGALIDGESDNYYLLEIRFRNIDNVRTGRKLHITNFDFANPLINGGNGFTSEYSGSVFLVERTEKEAVLFFDRIKCNVLNTDFTFDGYVRCPLSDKIPSDPPEFTTIL